MGKAGLISVIMSTKDTPDEYLRLAIESILGQSYKDIELIIVVDGSDNDLAIVKSIEDNRIRIIEHKTSMGLAASLNDAISIARGEYIARMDSDDYSLPRRLEIQRVFMQRHVDVDVCSTFARDFGFDNKIKFTPYYRDDAIKAQLFFGNVLVHPAVMFRASFLKENKIKYDEGYECSQDYELWTRIGEKCKFAIIPDILLLYRIHKRQISSKSYTEQSMFRDRCLERNIKRYAALSIEDGMRSIKILNNEKLVEDFSDLEKFVKVVILNNENRMLHKEIRRKFVLVSLRNILKKRALLCLVKYLSPYFFVFYVKKVYWLLCASIRLPKYRIGKIV